MNDVTVIDLFWLILKFLAALGLVALLGLVLFLVWAAAKRGAKTAWDILGGRNVSVTATVCFVLAVVGLVTCVIFGIAYLHDHPTFLH
jgi:ABC-type sulfate transport system permease component